MMMFRWYFVARDVWRWDGKVGSDEWIEKYLSGVGNLWCCVVPPEKRQKENKKEAKNFPIWFTFYVLKLPRFPYDERTGGRWDDTFRNLHLLFGNHAWICIYLHLYFIHNVRGGKKKESAEMFISLRFFSASRLPSTGLRWWFFHLIFLHSVHAGMSNKSFPQSWWQDSGWLRQSFGTTEISAGRKLWIMSVVRYMRVQREFLN